MMLEVIHNKIAQLIIKRREAHDNFAEQQRLTAQLTKLYDLKLLILQQQKEFYSN